MTRAVQQALELHSIFGNLAELLQTPHLESTAVRQHRAVPAHELLHATRFRNQLCARSQIKVVRIRKNNLSIEFADVAASKPLDRRRSPYRHKHGRRHIAVCRMDNPKAGLGFFGFL